MVERGAHLLDGLDRYARLWWLLLIVGVLGVAAGVIVLAAPDISLVTLAVVSGIFLLVDGIYDVFAAFGREVANRGPLALLGVLSVIVGVILVRHPIAGVVATALLLGIWMITMGIVRLVESFGAPGGSAWSVIVAVLEVIAGIVIVSTPGIGVATLAILVGIAFILRGLAMCAAAWGLRAVRA